MSKGDERLFRILDEKIDLLMQARQAAEALRVAEKAAAIAERTFPRHDLRQARLLRKLGILLRAESRPQEALAAFEQALDACEAAEAEGAGDSRLRARLHAHAGFLADEIHEEGAARRHYERAAALDAESPYLDRSTAAVIHNNLAIISKAEERADAAAEHYRLAVAASEQAHGADHLEVAVLLGNVGNFHMNERRLDEAIADHGRALAIRSQRHPAGHPDIAWSKAHLALAHQLREEPARAEELYREAFEIWDKAGVPDGTSSHAVAAQNFAQLLRDQGNEREALRFEKQARRQAGD